MIVITYVNNIDSKDFFAGKNAPFSSETNSGEMHMTFEDLCESILKCMSSPSIHLAKDDIQLAFLMGVGN